jgi:hypothetical protein
MKKPINIDDYDKVINWSYTLAKEYVIKFLVPQGVLSSRKFEEYKKQNKYLPSNFPRRPDDYFKLRGTWKGWDDFLGFPERKFGEKYYDYKTAMTVTQKAGITNSNHFRNWKARPKRIPSRPDLYYKEWSNWQEFLGDNYKKEKKVTHRKLSESDIKIIKHQLSLGVQGSVLAKHFNISEMQISRIKRGINWKNI